MDDGVHDADDVERVESVDSDKLAGFRENRKESSKSKSKAWSLIAIL